VTFFGDTVYIERDIKYDQEALGYIGKCQQRPKYCRYLMFRNSTTKRFTTTFVNFGHNKYLYIGWQWRNIFLSYLCQLIFRHVVGQALQNVSYSGITFFVR